LTVAAGAAAAGPAFCWATPLSATPVRIARSSPSERKSHDRRRIDFLLVVRDQHGRIREGVQRARLARVGVAEEATPIAFDGVAGDGAFVNRERRDRKEVHAVRSRVQLRAIRTAAAGKDEGPAIARGPVLVELLAAVPERDEDYEALPALRACHGDKFVRVGHRCAAAI